MNELWTNFFWFQSNYQNLIERVWLINVCLSFAKYQLKITMTQKKQKIVMKLFQFLFHFIICRGPHSAPIIWEITRDNEFYLLFIICGENQLRFDNFEKSGDNSKIEIMQKIILFIESTDNAYMKPEKIGDIFMNQFSIDENASCEILKRFELG